MTDEVPESTTASISRPEKQGTHEQSDKDDFIKVISQHAGWVIPAITALGALLGWLHIRWLIHPVAIGFHELAVTLPELLIMTVFVIVVICIGAALGFGLATVLGRSLRRFYIGSDFSFTSSHGRLALLAAVAASAAVALGGLVLYRNVWNDSVLLVLCASVSLSCISSVVLALAADATMERTFSVLLVAQVALLVGVAASMSYYDGRALRNGDRNNPPLILGASLEFDRVQPHVDSEDLDAILPDCLLFIAAGEGVLITYDDEEDRVWRLPADATTLAEGCPTAPTRQ